MPKTNFVKDIEDEEVEVKPAKKEKKKFDQSDGIICRSVTQGGLYLEGAKTKILYEWDDYGDESEVEYRDLVAEVRAKSQFVFRPCFIIDDEDFIAEFPQLEKFYKEKYTVKDLRKVLELPVGEMVDAIKELPKGAADSLKSIAAQQVSTGQLDSVRKIKALDEFFGTDLNLIGELISD